MFNIEKYTVLIICDTGRFRLKVFSAAGEQGAKSQVSAAEGCPDSAILSVKKCNSSKHKSKKITS